MLHRFLTACLAFIACVGVAFAEEAQVADGLTKSDWLVNTVNNNVEYSTALTSAFSTAGTSTVTVHHTAHGKLSGSKFSIEDGPTIDGLDMNGTWAIATVPNANSYTFTHTGTASGTTATTGTAVVSHTDWQDDGKMRFLCYMSHINYDDSIKHPGQQGAAHGHMYFGNTLANYASTYPILRATGLGTCDGGPLNRSAYWFPWMYNGNTDKVKYPVDAQWYYTNVTRRQLIEHTSPLCDDVTKNLQDGRPAACAANGPLNIDQQQIRRIQRGQSAIFGYDPSGVSAGTPGTGGYPTSYRGDMLAGAYRCHDSGGVQQGGTYRYLHHRSNASLGLTSNTSCPASGFVVVRVVSPDCWNGELDDTDDHYNHFAQHGNDSYGGAGGGNLCPATHPYPHLEFLFILTWSYSGGIGTVGNWYLSSDRFNGADYEPGETFHWDMKFAWNDDVMDFWAKNVHGMYPDPNVPPYIYGTGVDATVEEYAGGKHMRNTNDGGLGVVGITPCSASLGVAYGSCTLKNHTNLGIGISDIEVDVPANDVFYRKATKRRFH